MDAGPAEPAPLLSRSLRIIWENSACGKVVTYTSGDDCLLPGVILATLETKPSMTSPKNASEFVQVLEQASLIAPVHLQRIRNQIPPPSSPGFDSLTFAKALIKEGFLTPFQAKRLMAGRREGFFIGKYRLLDILGQGGMGRVYLAEQITMKRAVALKLIRFGDHESPAILVRFAREARAAAKLRHPNITQAFDFDQAGDYHYIAMEFIEGVTLQDWVAKCGALPWAQVAFYMAQAAAALEHAHQSGLVHRDVKPGNMMVDVQGSLKLLDLGLVNVPTEDDSLTLAQRDLILGTADYVAPEQALNSHTVDIRADLYSLGGVFYYLLTGRPPFSGKSAAQKIIAHQTEELRPLQDVAPEVPKRLADVVHKLMAKKPEDRYQTPTELLQILKPFAQVAARPTPPYDISLVKFARETVDKYLRFGVDAPPANNVPPANFGQSSMADFRIPADLLTPKPTGDLGSSVINKPVTPRSGTNLRKQSAARSADSGGKTPTPRTTPLPPNKRVPTLAVRPEPSPSKPRPKRTINRWVKLAIIFIIPNVAAVFVMCFLLARSPETNPNRPRANQPAARVMLAHADSTQTLTRAIATIARDGQVLVETNGAELPLDGVVIAGDKLANRGQFSLASKDKSKVVTLTAAAGPILRISNAEHLLVRDLILDGKGRSGPLVQIEGRNPGVTFQNVVIRNAPGTVVRLLDAQGDSGKPVRFVNVSFEVDEASVPICFQARSHDGSSRNIEIVGCTFKGAGTGILLTEPVDGVSIHNCVFAQGSHGVRFAPGPVLADASSIQVLSNWKIAGPFAEKSPPKFDTQLSGDSQPLGWTDSQSPVVDFRKMQKGKSVHLACTVERSSAAGPRRLFVGADEAITLWVNGQKVFEHDARQRFVPGQFTATANFQTGDNHIWLKSAGGRVEVDVAENFLPLTAADWRSVRIENNLFDSNARAIEFGVAPSQGSMIRAVGNRFRNVALYPFALLKSDESLRPGTFVAAENTDATPATREISPDYELLPLR